MSKRRMKEETKLCGDLRGYFRVLAGLRTKRPISWRRSSKQINKLELEKMTSIVGDYYVLAAQLELKPDTWGGNRFRFA